MEKNKKKILAIICAVVVLVVVGTTYAFITQTLTGSKKVTITAGTLSLVLNEGNAITISDALPMYDQVGMIQDKVFNFSLSNNTSNDTDYVLKLVKIASDNELAESDVKYYLTKEGVGEHALLSSLTDGVIDTGTIVGNDTIDYTLRLWINSAVTDNSTIVGKSLSYRIDVEASMVDENKKQTVTFAGITKEVSETSVNMFNYSSEGCIENLDTGEKTCSVDASNGIYMMEDDDGPSYYYRGKVDNLVKFGTYTKDYYVYKYNNLYFIDLKSCQEYLSSCSEDNKVLLYAASDNVPMYWRIVRINGDGTIRMIYAGTTPDATEQGLGIGSSIYTEKYNEHKYGGYTYDKLTTEVESAAKKGVDSWYSNFIEGTIYDSKIATGKFCSDSSGYETEKQEVMGRFVNIFASLRRGWAYTFGSGDNSPTFKCTGATDENFGGNYSLKVGLMTFDELIAAGGNPAENKSSYLYDLQGFWTMTPVMLDEVRAVVGIGFEGRTVFGGVDSPFSSLRPVINLKSDVVFKSGTDGSTLTPYELAE